MIKKLNDFEKNMLLMAGSAGVGMLYSYILYNSIHNNAFSVASILGLFFLGAFILSFSIRMIAKKNLDKKAEGINDKNGLTNKNNSKTGKKPLTDTKKGFYYGKKEKDKK